MSKVKTLADLKRLKNELKAKVELREKGDNPEGRVVIKIGMATSGIASGAREIMAFLTEELDKRNIDAVVIQTGDMGYCFAEPTIEVKRPGEEPILFGYVDRQKADEIIEKYIKNGELVEGILPDNYQSID
ncbi:MAG: (2Fe-2S) ferredoxin domain-containing protein [Bacteroidetes bacterium]|nr:(2Fe-2S) ferredoxin domain-containing protein [Bacteroidota bacterium]